MLIDRALRAAIGDFSTLFLSIVLVFGPLHLLYGIVFNDILALRDLHDAIAVFPPEQLVRGVGADKLERARIAFWLLVAVEIALSPVLARAAAQVLRDRASGEVPTAVGALRAVKRPAQLELGRGSSEAMLGVMVVVGAAVGILVYLIAITVAGFLPDGFAFATVSLTEAASRSAGAAFVAVGLVYAMNARTAEAREVPEVY